eukprot:scaffold253000_cov18-Tisochrysis_lutea.AAC.2
MALKGLSCTGTHHQNTCIGGLCWRLQCIQNRILEPTFASPAEGTSSGARLLSRSLSENDSPSPDCVSNAMLLPLCGPALKCAALLEV